MVELLKMSNLRIRIHNVGHGQAVHVFTPVGQTVVIDLGCSTDFSPLRWLKERTSTIDHLTITHPHGDHIDEILLLEKMGFTVRQFWRPKWFPKDKVYEQNQGSYEGELDAYFEMSDRYTIPIEENERVGNPSISGGVSIKKYASKSCGFSNINNHSGVTVIDYQGVTVVIPGDNEQASWSELMKERDFATAMNRANVFMASHHGRESGYCAEIFTEKPDLCVVSDGRVQDTDARQRYSYHAKGWIVHKKNGGSSEKRYCVTTRQDGFIDIKIGLNADSKTYLSVEID